MDDAGDTRFSMDDRLTRSAYVDFLHTTDLGKMYPRKNFVERIEKLLTNASICITARDDERLVVHAIDAAGGPKDISVTTWANRRARRMYASVGMLPREGLVGREAGDQELFDVCDVSEP